MRPPIILFAIGLFLVPVGRAADPLADLQSFADFKEINLKELQDGEVKTQRGAQQLARGCSAQSCFFLKASPKAAAEVIQTWDASSHPMLGVFGHHCFRGAAQAADFDQLKLDSGNMPVRWLVNRTLTFKPGQPDFQLSRAEADQLAAQVQGKVPNAELAGQCWRKLLMGRAARFQQDGIAGLPAYENGGTRVTSAAEIRALLKTLPRVAARFSAILAQARIADGASAPPAIAQNYWELFNVDGHAALKLGAVFVRPAEDHVQLVDCEYFVSNGYYTALIAYDLWPVEGGSLVVRVDLLSADSLADAKGIERLAHENILTLEIRKSIRFLCEDVAKRSR